MVVVQQYYFWRCNENMSNKAFIESNKEKIDAAYDWLNHAAAAEILWPARDRKNLCKPLKLDIENNNGDVIIIGDKIGPLGTFTKKGGRLFTAAGSKLTLDEAQAFTDKRMVDTLLNTRAAQAAYGDDARAPYGLVPIAKAIKIITRGEDIEDLILSYLSRKTFQPPMSAEEANDLESGIGNADKTRMLHEMASVLVDMRNSPGADVYDRRYEDYVIEHAFGADKLVHSLYMDYVTISHEKMVLFDDSHLNIASLGESYFEMGNRCTEATEKVVGKMVFMGRLPWISMKVMKIRGEMVNRPNFFEY